MQFCFKLQLPGRVAYTRQEGQHSLTGQRAANYRRDLGATYRTLIDGYLESPFPTARLL